MGPHSYEQGNGPDPALFDSGPVASMGPHSYEQGNLPDVVSMMQTGALQWGLTLTSKETRAPAGGDTQGQRGFNGASLLRARKPARPTGRTGGEYRLQWGLTLTSKETGATDRANRRRVQASMGPHSYEQGNVNPRTMPIAHLRASMGPHSYEQGNQGNGRNLFRNSHASMGPHSYEQGNQDT